MKDLINYIKHLLCIKTSEPPHELERSIEEGRTKLREQINLLRLSNSELTRVTKDLRFEVMQDLINDIARSK